MFHPSFIIVRSRNVFYWTHFCFRLDFVTICATINHHSRCNYKKQHTRVMCSWLAWRPIICSMGVWNAIHTIGQCLFLDRCVCGTMYERRTLQETSHLHGGSSRRYIGRQQLIVSYTRGKHIFFMCQTYNLSRSPFCVLLDILQNCDSIQMIGNNNGLF